MARRFSCDICGDDIGPMEGYSKLFTRDSVVDVCLYCFSDATAELQKLTTKPVRVVEIVETIRKDSYQ